jgi:hypothetical protein
MEARDGQNEENSSKNFTDQALPLFGGRNDDHEQVLINCLHTDKLIETHTCSVIK